MPQDLGGAIQSRLVNGVGVYRTLLAAHPSPRLRAAVMTATNTLVEGNVAAQTRQGSRNFDDISKTCGERLLRHFVIRPPKPGPWHLVVDLAGLPGEVVASVSLRPDDSG